MSMFWLDNDDEAAAVPGRNAKPASPVSRWHAFAWATGVLFLYGVSSITAIAAVIWACSKLAG